MHTHRKITILCLIASIFIVMPGCTKEQNTQIETTQNYIDETTTMQESSSEETSTKEVTSEGTKENTSEDALEKAIKQLEELNDILEEE